MRAKKKWTREMDYYQRNLPILMKKYPGKYLAIKGNAVTFASPSMEDLIITLGQHGYNTRVFYIAYVDAGRVLDMTPPEKEPIKVKAIDPEDETKSTEAEKVKLSDKVKKVKLDEPQV